MNGTDVTIPGDPSHGDPSLPAYARLPPGATRGMVVIHEIFGPAPDIHGVVDRFASKGYAAVAPNLFAHGQLACIRSVMGALGSGNEVSAVRAARRTRAWLCAQAGLTDARVGIIGFCFGGGFALLAGPGFGAVSSNYGEIPTAKSMEGIGPVLACYGGRDLLFRSKGELLKKRLATVGATPEVHVFPDAGHAFLTNSHHPIAAALTWPLMHVRYDPKLADEGWQKIDAFFERHLAPA